MPASKSSVEVAVEVERDDVGVEFESKGLLGVFWFVWVVGKGDGSLQCGRRYLWAEVASQGLVKGRGEGGVVEGVVRVCAVECSNSGVVVVSSMYSSSVTSKTARMPGEQILHVLRMA